MSNEPPAEKPPFEQFFRRLHLVIRVRHYSHRTERAYTDWVKRFIRYHSFRDPRAMGAVELSQYLTWLAQSRGVSAATQNQAAAAISFFYRHVLGRKLEDLESVVRARRSRRLPTVLSQEEVQLVMSHLRGTPRLVSLLLYGAGLRLLEALRLRVKDLDFDLHVVQVRSGKGRKDRTTMLPQVVVPDLREHMNRVWVRHREELATGGGRVILPEGIAQKYPHADREWGWQYLFPAAPRPSRPHARRPHLHESVIQRAVREAVQKSGVAKQASCHTFRHSFATHLLIDGYDIRTVQELLGHRKLVTTMVYTHILNQVGGRAVRSPADKLFPFGDA